MWRKLQTHRIGFLLIVVALVIFLFVARHILVHELPNFGRIIRRQLHTKGYEYSLVMNCARAHNTDRQDCGPNIPLPPNEPSPNSAS